MNKVHELGKKIIILTGIAVFYASFAWAAITYGVKYGPHNLGATGEGLFVGGTTETEICIFCHTPHNAVSGQKWLWNRTGATSDFRLYTASPTLNFTVSGITIGETSKMCMTCHDGATAMNAMANPRTGTDSTQMGDVWNPDLVWEWGKNVGERTNTGPSGDTIPGAANLTNDHPISFDYVQSYTGESAKGTLRDINTVKAAGLVFWGANQQMLECVTCHDPHVNYGCWDWRNCDQSGGGSAVHSKGNFDRTLAPFLRKSNNSSSLCFTCHNK